MNKSLHLLILKYPPITKVGLIKIFEVILKYVREHIKGKTYSIV